jgi:hypothetical protein
MMSEEHETLAALISSLNIRRYQNLLGGPLEETKRHAMQARLREEEVWMKNHTPPFCTAPRFHRIVRGHDSWHRGIASVRGRQELCCVAVEPLAKAIR